MHSHERLLVIIIIIIIVVWPGAILQTIPFVLCLPQCKNDKSAKPKLTRSFSRHFQLAKKFLGKKKSKVKVTRSTYPSTRMSLGS